MCGARSARPRPPPHDPTPRNPTPPGDRPRTDSVKTDPDRELVEACQVGEPTGLDGAFRQLYEQYKDRVYNVCYRISGNPTDALDASQETFGILFRKIVEFRFESKFSSWVYRIAVNASIDLKRRTSTRWIASLDAQSEPGSSEHARTEVRD